MGTCSIHLEVISQEVIEISIHKTLGLKGTLFNSLAPGILEWNFRQDIFKLILVIGGWGISCEFAIRWMSLDFTDDKSALVQVLAWSSQATIHYLNQCWPRSMSSYDVNRFQCVMWLTHFPWQSWIHLQLIYLTPPKHQCGIMLQTL